jgi:LemA protein
MVPYRPPGGRLPEPVSFALVVLAALVLVAAVIYNGLIRRRNRVDTTWSDIDVLLRRRHDLIPNLVSAVQGYAGHESVVLRAVADSRATALAAQGPAARGDAESTLSGGVKTLIADAEAYPDLKASKSFVDLQIKLTQTEDGLAHARQFYNDAVFGYNTAIQTLPGNLVASAFGFKARQLFQAAGNERAAGQVRA